MLQLHESQSTESSLCHFVVACTIYSAPALAQRPGTADLAGSVTDESRAVLPAATVVARNQLTGVSHETITGADGTYRFVSLTPGVYEITARLDGFRSAAYPDFRVSVGEVARLDFELALSALSETITVVARPPAVDVAQTQLGQVVQSEQLANLPVGIRSFVNFASLAPGVNANFARAGASFTAGALSSNGQDNGSPTSPSTAPPTTTTSWDRRRRRRPASASMRSRNSRSSPTRPPPNTAATWARCSTW